MNTKEPPVVYHLRVKLKFDKRTYRDILIRSNQSFDQLHGIIFTAFDRYDEHLYRFSINQSEADFPVDMEPLRLLFKQMGCKVPARRKAEPIRVESPECCDGYNENGLNAEHTTLSRFQLKPKQKFEYLFDFGDEWRHEIEVIGIVPIETGTKYPRIIKVNGKSPDQYPDPDDE